MPINAAFKSEVEQKWQAYLFEFQRDKTRWGNRVKEDKDIENMLKDAWLAGVESGLSKASEVARKFPIST